MRVHVGLCEYANEPSSCAYHHVEVPLVEDLEQPQPGTEGPHIRNAPVSFLWQYLPPSTVSASQACSTSPSSARNASSGASESATGDGWFAFEWHHCDEIETAFCKADNSSWKTTFSTEYLLPNFFIAISFYFIPKAFRPSLHTSQQNSLIGCNCLCLCSGSALPCSIPYLFQINGNNLRIIMPTNFDHGSYPLQMYSF